MALTVVKKDNRFRIEWQGNSLDWLPDTTSNRKAIVVFLRLLRDERGKRMFTFRELSLIVSSEKRQASSGHVERFREYTHIICKGFAEMGSILHGSVLLRSAIVCFR